MAAAEKLGGKQPRLSASLRRSSVSPSVLSLLPQLRPCSLLCFESCDKRPISSTPSRLQFFSCSLLVAAEEEGGAAAASVATPPPLSIQASAVSRARLSREERDNRWLPSGSGWQLTLARFGGVCTCARAPAGVQA